MQKEISGQRVTFEELIGRAANYVNDMDGRQKAIIAELEDLKLRMRSQRLEDGHRQQDHGG